MDGRRRGVDLLTPTGHPPLVARLPDFLVIGAPKAGTTTLAADLSRHPSLWIPPEKELGFFDVRWQHESMEAYGARFAAAPPDRLVGEATPTYLHAPGAMERVAAEVPAARLVVLLRDPVDRAWSHYWYNCMARLVEHLPPDEAFARKSAEYLGPGDYASHLRRVHGLFDPEQVLVLVLDDLAADPAGTFAEVCRHLAVPEIVPPDVGTTRNSSYRVRSQWIRRQMYRYSLWTRLPGRLGFRLEEWNHVPFRAPPIPDHIRDGLRAHYADDTSALVDLLGRHVPWSATSATTP